MKKEYNGWKNHQTWNVAFWINNDEYLYRAATEFMENNNNKKSAPYGRFIKKMGMEYDKTPDGIAYAGTRLDYRALNDMMRELV